MCIHAGKDELDSVKVLMSMSLRAVVATALHTDLEAIDEGARLVEDLHMGEPESEELEAMIADVFDGIHVDPHETPTYGSLLDRVVMSEFRGLPV